MISNLDYYDLESCINDLFLLVRIREIKNAINNIITNDFKNIESDIRKIDNSMGWIVETISMNEKETKRLKEEKMQLQQKYDMEIDEYYKLVKEQEFGFGKEELKRIKQENKILKATLGLVDDLESFTVSELKEACAIKGVEKSGEKQELIDRLTA